MTMTVMNHIARCTTVLTLGVFLFGCSDRIMPDEPYSPSTPVNSLRFGVAEMSVNTRSTQSSDDILRTTFDNGDKIGCVIAEKRSDESFDYKVNTEWTYQNGYLILEKEIQPQQYAKDIVKSYSDGDYIRRLNSKEEFASSDDRYLELMKSGMSYAFFFYYPYFDDAMIYNGFTGSQPPTGPQELVIPFSQILYPIVENYSQWNTYNNLHYVYTTRVLSKDYSSNMAYLEKTTRYPWNAFPCYASEWQNTNTLMSRSDFMWTRYIEDSKSAATGAPQDITSENATYEVKLTFHKKMAAIVVNSEEPLDDSVESVYFQNDIIWNGNGTYGGSNSDGYANGYGAYVSGGINQGVKIDIKDGKCSEYNVRKYLGTGTGGLGSLKYPIQEFASKTDKKLIPWHREGDLKQFRLILPPQKDFGAKLHFKFKGHDKEYVINLGEKLHELEENKVYIINLRPVGWDIIIEDWIDDNQGILIENEPRDPQA